MPKSKPKATQKAKPKDVQDAQTAQKKPVPKLTSKETFLESLKNNHAHISNACIAAKIGRRTYYDWIEQDADFKTEVEAVIESLVDIAQDKLMQRVSGVQVVKFTPGDEGAMVYSLPPDVDACKFILKTLGKKRGYVERNETVVFDLSKASKEQLERIASGEDPAYVFSTPDMKRTKTQPPDDELVG